MDKEKAMSDFVREIAIRAAMELHVFAYRVMRWAGDQHKHLVFGRSATQVARMESKKGLR